MWEKIRIVFTIPELRQKIFLTLFLLAIYRVGWQIPLPIINSQELQQLQSTNKNILDTLNQVAIFSGAQLSNITIFGLGIMPYISASIIFQILATVYPPLERLQKEGEAGRKKINEYTRYATVIVCLLQSWAYVTFYAVQNGLVYEDLLVGVGTEKAMPFTLHALCVLIMTAGSVFLMWIGEQIDEYGIGNGISLLIMAGILARMPQAFFDLINPMVKKGISLASGPGEIGIELLVVLALLFVAVIGSVVYVTQAQRRIPMQSAKQVRGRRVFGGLTQYLPLRLNTSGVMPIVFAGSFLLIPATIFSYIANYSSGTIFSTLSESFQRGAGFVYNALYVAMIFGFSYFWITITFNPKDVANNLQDHGSFIPGIRPGRRTAEYLERVMMRITYVGAAFLSAVAIFPNIVSKAVGIDMLAASFFGGTGLLIAVSVAFDLVQKIDSHLVMRNYRGLLEKS